MMKDEDDDEGDDGDDEGWHARVWPWLWHYPWPPGPLRTAPGHPARPPQGNKMNKSPSSLDTSCHARRRQQPVSPRRRRGGAWQPWPAACCNVLPHPPQRLPPPCQRTEHTAAPGAPRVRRCDGGRRAAVRRAWHDTHQWRCLLRAWPAPRAALVCSFA